MNNKIIGVIGAGTIGRGVVYTFAKCGYEVIMVDIDDEALKNAIDEIETTIKFQSMFDKNTEIEASDTILSRIRPTNNLELLSSVGFIVENIPENLHKKAELHKTLSKICDSSCIVAVNTSCIPITEIACHSNREQNMIGIHFMNPVHLIKAVEVIKGFHTSKETIETTLEIISDIGMEGIVVNDQAGFVSNRISHLMMNEAAFIVHENIATAMQVDDIFRKCYGHKMGPLETADLIGLDTVVNSLEVLYESYQDSKFRCCPLLKKMVNARVLGRKTGRGFYEYE